MKKIYKSIIYALMVSLIFNLSACADSDTTQKQDGMANMSTIVNNLQSAGFMSIDSINYSNGNYAVNGIVNGIQATAYVEPNTGKIIQEKNYIQLEQMDSIKKLVNNLKDKHYYVIYSIELNDDQNAYEVKAKGPEANKVSLTVKNGVVTSH